MASRLRNAQNPDHSVYLRNSLTLKKKKSIYIKEKRKKKVKMLLRIELLAVNCTMLLFWSP